MPVADPGAAVSPGTRIWSFVNGPAFTVSDWVASVRPVSGPLD